MARTRGLPFEFMMNALRLTDGFAVAMFEERTGFPLQPPSGRWPRPSAAG